ncbi:MAG: Alkaline phosphatase [Massilia sp.]|nr:Alkaline phosphatase [Massilia sp.]
MRRARRAITLLVAAAALAWADAGAQSVTVLAAGDIANCGTQPPQYSGAFQTAALIDIALAQDPSARLLALGDLTYPRGRLAEFTGCYQATWGRFKARTYPTPGNHEYATPKAAGYFTYFGAQAGAGHYAFTLGAWRLISLDSNLDAAGNAAQLAWLKQELATTPARCTLAYWHHPMYSSGMKGVDPRMRPAWELLMAAGAELVLAGHDHLYERFAPQDGNGRLDTARGIRQFVVGTGGAFPTPLLLPLPNSEARDSNHMGVLRLVLRADGYDWAFLPVGADALFKPDRGSAPCH